MGEEKIINLECQYSSWRGENENGIMILGESHYDKQEDGTYANVGKPVLDGADKVVKDYLKHCEPGGEKAGWDRFFSRIADTFGYEKSADKKIFYEKVWFRNYITHFCGVNDSAAQNLAEKHRIYYNNVLFSLINEKNIRIIVCFSKLAYWKLPNAHESDRLSARTLSKQMLKGRRNVINVYEYLPGVEHGYCDIELNQPLTVYGIRHPSSRGGYCAKDVHDMLIEEDKLKELFL